MNKQQSHGRGYFHGPLLQHSICAPICPCPLLSSTSLDAVLFGPLSCVGGIVYRSQGCCETVGVVNVPCASGENRGVALSLESGVTVVLQG